MTNHSLSNRQLYWLAAWLLIALGLVRFWLTRDLALFGDEAFYWLESRHPDWGYSDVPLLTPLLVGLGTQLIDHHYSGVRILFVLMGSLIPLAVGWLALPLTGPRHALISIVACLAMPLLTGMGILALPDVPLVLVSTLVLGMAVRAQQHPHARQYWIGLGALMAAGFLAHYRFALIPLALLAASLSSQHSRSLWRTANPWLACLIAMTGLLPALWFNANNDYAAIGFHFHQRHPWHFQTEGLMYPVLQALSTSPLMLLALLAAFRPLWQACRRDTPGARLLLATSVLYLGVFGALAPWTDQRSTNVHWPLIGYIPLLVFLPVLLSDLRTRLGQRTTTVIASIVWLSGVTATVFGGLWLYAMPRLESLPYATQRHITANMAGWSAIAERAHNYGDAPIITDNYYLAAQLAFELQRTQGIYTIDDDKVHRDGRARQLALWGWQPHNDAWPESAIAVLEASRHNMPEWQRITRTLCERYPGLREAEHMEQFKGRRKISILRLQTGAPGKFCQPPIQGWIDETPADDATLLHWYGWYTDASGIQSIDLLLDEHAVARAHYGIERTDAAAQFDANASPDLPNIGFSLQWDSTQAPAGWHRLQVVVSSHNGNRLVPWERWIYFESATH